MTSVPTALKTALVAAMKRRDRAATSAYRTALAAISNAEAVPLPDGNRAEALEAITVGVGQSETQRRILTEPQMVAIVRGEIAERRTTADSVAGARPDVAEQLRHEASLLAEIIDGRG
jgi:uncharacterized protein YqeY